MSVLPADLKLSHDQESLDRPRNYMEELEKLIPKDRFSKEEYAVIEDKLLILRLLTQEQLSKRNRDDAFIRAQKMSLETMAQENKTQILSLHKELSSAKAELEINQRTIADLQQKLKEDNRKNKILKDSNAALTNQVLTLERESSSVKAELQINQRTIADLQQKLEKENTNNKILKDSNNALTDQVITLKRDLTSIKVDADDTRRTTEDLKQRLEGSTKQVNILKHQNHQKFTKLDAIRIRLMGTKSRLRSLDEETKLRNQLRSGINWQWYFTDTNYYTSPLYYGEFNNSQSKTESIPEAVAAVIADFVPELTTRESLETIPNRTEVLVSQDTLDTIVTETLSSKPIDSQASEAAVIADFVPELTKRESLETVPNRTEVLFSQDTLDTIVTETLSSKPIDSQASKSAVIADFAPELTTRESLETVPNRNEVLFSQDTFDTVVTETLSSKPIDFELSSESATLPCTSEALCSVSFEIEPVSSVPDITSSVSKVEFQPQSTQKTETFRPKDVITTQNEVASPIEKNDAEVPHSSSKEKASKAVLFATVVQCSTKKIESSANEASFMKKNESSSVSEAIFSETPMSAAEVAMSSTAIATVTIEAKSISIPLPRPRSFLLKCGEIDTLTVVKPSNSDFLKTTNLRNTLEVAPDEEVLNTKLNELQALSLTPPVAPRLRQHCKDEIDIRVKSTGNKTRPISLSSTQVPSPRPRRRPASVLIPPLAETDALSIEVSTSKTETTAAAEVSSASAVEATGD